MRRMKKTDRLKEKLQDKIIAMDELDIMMEDIGYNPVEIDDNENNVIKCIKSIKELLVLWVSANQPM